jgi:hypothetical protein
MRLPSTRYAPRRARGGLFNPPRKFESRHDARHATTLKTLRWGEYPVALLGVVLYLTNRSKPVTTRQALVLRSQSGFATPTGTFEQDTDS